MAFVTHENAITQPSTALVDFWHGIGGFFAAVANAGHAAARYQQLSAMSAGQIGALGYSTDEAAKAAFEESFGKL